MPSFQTFVTFSLCLRALVFFFYPAGDQFSDNWRTPRDMLRVLFLFTMFFLDELVNAR